MLLFEMTAAMVNDGQTSAMRHAKPNHASKNRKKVIFEHNVRS